MFSRAEAEMMRRPWQGTMKRQDNRADSVYRLLLPKITQATAPVTIEATYRDKYGRLYRAWSVKTVHTPVR
jgi:hypothetical protein